MPNISYGVVGVSSGGHPGVVLVVPDAPVEPFPAPPGPAIAPHHGEHAWQPPHSRITGITAGSPWGDTGGPEHPKGER